MGRKGITSAFLSLLIIQG